MTAAIRTCYDAPCKILWWYGPSMPDEFDAWAQLWDGYNAFYGRHGATALSAQIIAHHVAAFL